MLVYVFVCLYMGVYKQIEAKRMRYISMNRMR